MINMLGAAFNAITAIVVAWVAYRNFIVFRENERMSENIGKAMRMMKQLRDLLDDDLEDPFTAGDASKEVRH